MTKVESLLKLLEDVSGSDGEKLASEIKQGITKIFPDSYVNVGFSANISPCVKIQFALGKDKSEWANGIFQNDPAKSAIFIHGFNRDGSVKNLNMDGSYAGSFHVKSKNPHYAFDVVKVPCRFPKSTVTPEQALKLTVGWFEKLKKSLQANRDNLTDADKKRIGDKF